MVSMLHDPAPFSWLEIRCQSVQNICCFWCWLSIHCIQNIRRLYVIWILWQESITPLLLLISGNSKYLCKCSTIREVSVLGTYYELWKIEASCTKPYSGSAKVYIVALFIRKIHWSFVANVYRTSVASDVDFQPLYTEYPLLIIWTFWIESMILLLIAGNSKYLWKCSTVREISVLGTMNAGKIKPYKTVFRVFWVNRIGWHVGFEKNDSKNTKKLLFKIGGFSVFLLVCICRIWYFK